MIRNFMKRNSIVIAFVVIVLLFTYTVVRAIQPGDAKEWMPYQVQSGDTIWEIAAQHNVFRDVRDTVALIRGENNVRPEDLRPGMTIQVPIK